MKRRTIRAATRNILLTIEYEGTRFAGWQRQAGYPSVQQSLEEAVEACTGEPAHVQGAGRTDAGVHAEGQRANFLTRSRIPLERLPHALNAQLPPDIAVKAAREVGLDFHARYAARAKTYRYRILCRSSRPALDRRCCVWLRGPLDLGAMRQAAGYLTGRHDFRSFVSEGARHPDCVREVFRLDIGRAGDYIEFVIEAEGFLHHMVRCVVGTLLDVGRGRHTPEQLREILAAQDRAKGGPRAPAQGLTLVRVAYDEGALGAEGFTGEESGEK